MSRLPLIHRLGVVVAGAATMAVLAAGSLPGIAAAAGAAPLVDGGRPVAAPRVTVSIHAVRQPAQAGVTVRASALAVVAPAGGDPCTDKARSFNGDVKPHWQETVRWAFRARSTPANLGKRATARALVRAMANIVGAHNDCGRRDRVSATATFLGVTDRRPAPTENGACAQQDGVNVVGFGELPDGIAGLTCVWSIGDRIIEADIKLDKDARWATSLTGCDVQSLVEAVATHEFGHVYGLGHVREATHGRLTMSERLDGYCQNNESTLGLGDMLGLEALY